MAREHKFFLFPKKGLDKSQEHEEELFSIYGECQMKNVDLLLCFLMLPFRSVEISKFFYHADFM